MRYIIYGAGGIGCTIGAHLFRTGHNVVLVGNAQHMDTIEQKGLEFATGDEVYTLDISVCKKAMDLLPFQQGDVVLLCAKSQHTVNCLGELKNVGAPSSLPILCCQNSIYNEPTAIRVFDKIYGVLIYVPAIFLSPGKVANPIAKRAGFMEIGCYPSGTDSLCNKISRDLTESSFSADTNPNIMKTKGTKCLGNLINSVLAITDGKGDSTILLKKVQMEAETVWKSAGIEWEDPKSFNERRKGKYGIRKLPKGYESLSFLGSSWQSLSRGTGNIEAEYLNGDVVRLGRMLGISTPYNHLLWKIADEMAQNGEKPGKYSTEELMQRVCCS